MPEASDAPDLANRVTVVVAVGAVLLHLFAGLGYVALLDPHPSLVVLFLGPAGVSVLAGLGAWRRAGRAPAVAAVMWQVLFLVILIPVTLTTAAFVYAPGFVAQCIVLARTPKDGSRPSVG
jgi:hypothetical protein